MSPLSKKLVRYNVELISDTETYPGFVETVSEDDIFLLVPPNIAGFDSSPGTPFRLVIKPPSGENVNLDCRVKWSYKTPPVGLMNIIAEVTDSLPTYKTFYRSIH